MHSKDDKQKRRKNGEKDAKAFLCQQHLAVKNEKTLDGINRQVFFTPNTIAKKSAANP